MRLYMTELTVLDWPRCVAWYRDVLGLPVEILDMTRRFALLGGDGGRIALSGRISFRTAPKVKLSFVVKDLEAVRERMRELEGAPTAIVADLREGYRSFRVLDPEGVPIQVFAWGA